MNNRHDFIAKPDHICKPMYVPLYETKDSFEAQPDNRTPTTQEQRICLPLGTRYMALYDSGELFLYDAQWDRSMHITPALLGPMNWHYAPDHPFWQRVPGPEYKVKLSNYPDNLTIEDTVFLINRARANCPHDKPDLRASLDKVAPVPCPQTLIVLNLCLMSQLLTDCFE